MLKSTSILLAPAIAGLAFAAAPASAEVRVLDFAQGNYCRDGQLCTNNGDIDQTYGDTADLNVTTRSVVDGRTNAAFYYERGFGDLVGVIFAGNGQPTAEGQIQFDAAEGFELSLLSFDAGCFGGNANCQSFSYSVFVDGGLTGRGTGSTGYPGHTTQPLGTRYARSVLLTFGTGENVGLDNIRFDIRPTAATPAVPEPATWAMMIGGFGLVGGAMRRRNLAIALTA